MAGGFISKAGAWCNGEVAYIAWAVPKKIPDCLGFMITRIHETGGDKGAHRILPAWVSFTDQSNPDWEEQDTSVWPIQAFQWRDLTLRKSRNTTKVRPIDFKVHYEIVPVGLAGAGRTLVPVSETAPYKDAAGKARYEGPPRKLYMLDKPFATNSINVTHTYSGKKAVIEATFTNGILSTQNLLKQLESIGKATPAPGDDKHLLTILKKEIVNPASDIRSFLTGDALSFLTRLLERAEAEGGALYMALYELTDPELLSLLEARARKGQVHIILSTAGSTKQPKGADPSMIWDTENNDARAALHAITKCDIEDRMFNTSAGIGHNKFVVYTKGNKAEAVLTGSTNWTANALCAQSNNAILIEDPQLADEYWAYWKRLRDDPFPARQPITAGKTKGAKPNNADQNPKLRSANAHAPTPIALADGKSSAQLWCSPNTPKRSRTEKSPTPPDLNDVYWLMAHAKEAVFFLVFLPGESGKQNIIGEAADLAAARPDLFVLGAVSDPSALPNYTRVPKGQPDPDVYTDPTTGKPKKLPARAIWWPNGDDSRIAFIRAAAVNIPIGNFRPELLSAGHAIIHDKIIVIDPLDAENCAVITGSHNLGYKASYSNDENLLIIKGNRDLAVSYAVHVIDLYDHYLFRAKLEDQIRATLKAGHAPAEDTGHGFLKTNPAWQDRFFAQPPRSSLDYFLKHLPA